MKKIFAALLLLAQALPAKAAGDPVLDAMAGELDRTMTQLRMDDLQGPYFVSYTVTDSTDNSIAGVFGALRDDGQFVSRDASVELRIGSAAFDSSGYVGQDYYGYLPVRGQLNEESDYDALRFSLWSLTDDAYKRALEKYSQKLSYAKKKTITGFYGDLSPAPREAYFDKEGEAPPFDRAAWRDRVRELSGLFRKYPAIQSSVVSFDLTARTVRFADSGGTRYRYRWDKVSLEVSATVQDRTGLRIGDTAEFSWRALADVPPMAELKARTEKFAAQMSSLASPATAEIYLGPVLFEDQAAAEFLGQLFADNISFGRTPWADDDDSTRYYIHSGGLTKKLGMRVLPAFMSAFDDPLAESYEGIRLNGYYPVDAEGVRPARMELVKNGKLVSFYAGRTPVKEFRVSNGHARGLYNEFPTPRPGNVIFTAAPEKRVPAAELKKKLLAMAAESGLEYAVLVRRLDPAVSRSPEDLLAAPVLAYKVSVKDGSETPLSATEWSGVSFRALRDITLVSDADYVYNYYQAGPFVYERGYVPAAIAAPSGLLVQEMELKPAEAKPDRPPYLPHPYFAK